VDRLVCAQGDNVIPKLKPVGLQPVPGGVQVVADPRAVIDLDDPDGSVHRLLTLLAEGSRTPAELVAAVGAGFPTVTADDVAGAIEALDGLRLLEDAGRPSRLTAEERERHFSNLAFFQAFADLRTGAEDVLARLRDSHVLLLGVGGLGSNVLQNLAGLGIGRLTLVDRDRVDPRNFARQFVYRARDVGRSKVERAAEWVAEFDPSIKVDTVETELASAADVTDLLGSVRPDAVSSGADSPREMDLWVNEACVRAGVPFCRAGMFVTEAIVWSVRPGESACLACNLGQGGEERELAWDRAAGIHGAAVPRTNRGTGPIATQLGSCVASELARFLTGYAPPVYTNGCAVIDLAGDWSPEFRAVSRNPRCPVCSGTPAAGSPGDPPEPDQRRREA
jgi:molybdopterin/thiamine biosynthesis adenylyltransferase